MCVDRLEHARAATDKASVPLRNSAGVCRCDLAIGRATPTRPIEPTMNATSWTATGPPMTATTKAAIAATATKPSTSVSVSASAPAHTAATRVQTSQAAITRSYAALSARAGGEPTGVIVEPQRQPEGL